MSRLGGNAESPDRQVIARHRLVIRESSADGKKQAGRRAAPDDRASAALSAAETRGEAMT